MERPKTVTFVPFVKSPKNHSTQSIKPKRKLIAMKSFKSQSPDVKILAMRPSGRCHHLSNLAWVESPIITSRSRGTRYTKPEFYQAYKNLNALFRKIMLSVALIRQN